MAKKGHSDPDAFGGYRHYGANGKKIGESRPNVFGGYTNYDARGKKVGESRPDAFGGYTHYDKHGKKVGRTRADVLGGYTHFDAKGKKTAVSNPRVTGGYTTKQSEGCYIATCVYGSYTCPQVCALRRYRDGVLRASAPGRAFIKAYYALSPRLTRLFGGSRVFRSLCRGPLDLIVRRLRKKGFSGAPYEDLTGR